MEYNLSVSDIKDLNMLSKIKYYVYSKNKICCDGDLAATAGQIVELIDARDNIVITIRNKKE